MLCAVVSHHVVYNKRCSLLFCRLKENAGSLTNFEVLDFLRSRGAKIDPMGCLGAVAASECKVIACSFAALYLMLRRLNLFLCAVLCLNWSNRCHLISLGV
jgi:hypothetical protein